MKKVIFSCETISILLLLFVSVASAETYEVQVDGTDAIFLAGRTDVTIPPASELWIGDTILLRHPWRTPEEMQETLPKIIPVKEGDVIRLLDPAIGGISFFNGFGKPFYGPSGNGEAGSKLRPLDGISGYAGPEGALTGVFLSDAILDTEPAPLTLDFTPTGIGTHFATLSPLIGQVFYIGDGVKNNGETQTFITPKGATRLALGVPDGFLFDGEPGAYDDNDGSYLVRLGINTNPGKSGAAKKLHTSKEKK